jgi:hypothetical protein
MIPIVNQIIDGSGTIWTLDMAGDTYANGAFNGGTGIMQLLYYNGVVYANTGLTWYSYSSIGWTLSSDPRTPPPSPTRPPSASVPQNFFGLNLEYVANPYNPNPATPWPTAFPVAATRTVAAAIAWLWMDEADGNMGEITWTTFDDFVPDAISHGADVIFDP